MRYAVIADIHGNLEAFSAVLNALSGERIDDYIFVGDVVGYGADPKECIKLLKGLKPVIAIAGNHEWATLEKLDMSYFSELAAAAILCTKKILNKEELEYLRSLELLYEDGNKTVVHGTLNMPEEFYYVFDTEDAYFTLSQMRSPLCFIGHSHVPGIFSYTYSKVCFLERTNIRIDLENKYLINVGSVGQPRDGDPRASFAVYDDEDLTIEVKRIEYDVKKAQEKILKAGLPSKLADRLSEGR